MGFIITCIVIAVFIQHVLKNFNTSSSLTEKDDESIETASILFNDRINTIKAELMASGDIASQDIENYYSEAMTTVEVIFNEEEASESDQDATHFIKGIHLESLALLKKAYHSQSQGNESSASEYIEQLIQEIPSVKEAMILKRQALKMKAAVLEKQADKEATLEAYRSIVRSFEATENILDEADLVNAYQNIIKWCDDSDIDEKLTTTMALIRLCHRALQLDGRKNTILFRPMAEAVLIAAKTHSQNDELNDAIRLCQFFLDSQKQFSYWRFENKVHQIETLLGELLMRQQQREREREEQLEREREERVECERQEQLTEKDILASDAYTAKTTLDIHLNDDELAQIMTLDGALTRRYRSEPLMRQAISLSQANKPTDALNCFDALIANHKGYSHDGRVATALLSKGYVLTKMGDYENALACLTQMLERFSDSYLYRDMTQTATDLVKLINQRA